MSSSGDPTEVSVFSIDGSSNPTYFLLKKLQETGGNVTYGELANYLEDNVELESVVTNDKRQTPQVLVSPEIGEYWKDWRFVK